MRPAAQNYALIPPFHDPVIRRRRGSGKQKGNALAIVPAWRHGRAMTGQARIFAALLACLAWAGLVLHVQLGMGRNPHFTIWEELWRSGRYFTVLTNALTAVTMTRVALGARIGSGFLAGLTLWMVIVAVVYHTLLARDHEGIDWIKDQTEHTLVPLGLLLWWLRFAPKSGPIPRDALHWLAWPGGYMAYALIRGEIDGRHPYFFIDPPLIGWPKVCMWIAALTLGFYAAGRGMAWLCGRLSLARPGPAGRGPDGLRPRSPTDRGHNRADG